MAEFNGVETGNVVEYLSEVCTQLPQRVGFDSGVLLFKSSDVATIKVGDKSVDIPSFTCDFQPGNLGNIVDLSNPIPNLQDFRLRYIGSMDGNFTVPNLYLKAKFPQLVGFDLEQFRRRKFGLPHEQGHAFMNWRNLSLKLLQVACGGASNLLPKYPNIEKYCDFVRNSSEIGKISYPNSDGDLLAITLAKPDLKMRLELFEERYAWGVGLALLEQYPGFSKDRLLLDAHEVVANALITYAGKYMEPLFNDGFTREDSILNLAYFFKQKFKEK